MPWILETLGAVELWRPQRTPAGCVVAMTTRRGGVSAPPYDELNLGRSTEDLAAAVTENRRRVLHALGFSAERVATAGQVHGTRVTEVRAAGLHPETDALVTREAGLALAVSGADCLPIVYCAGRAVAAAHSGWRGTADGMPRTALAAILALSGTAAAEARVYLGPCIGPCCYRVGDEVAARFPEAAVVHRESGSFVHLATAARLQLESAGVPPHAILDPPACTACDSRWCYSHRRDRGVTGRLWGIAGRIPDADGWGADYSNSTAPAAPRRSR
jgi:polyphenol oxidase